MKTEKIYLWNEVPGMCEETPYMTAYIPDEKKSNGAVVIFPGGGYGMRAPHEGKGYAEFLARFGITSFVCEYRVYPHRFPLPLLDARRSVRYVRHNADKYGLDKNMIFVMGSSAGGHLAAMTSTYTQTIEFENADEIDNEDYRPNGQILCYPVIKLLGKGISHLGSGANLLGDKQAEMGEELSPDLIADENTPRAFIWHTFDDGAVNVINSLDYAKTLKNKNVEVEMHIYPHGSHGLGLAEDTPHVNNWSSELIKWFKYIEFLND